MPNEPTRRSPGPNCAEPPAFANGISTTRVAHAERFAVAVERSGQCGDRKLAEMAVVQGERGHRRRPVELPAQRSGDVEATGQVRCPRAG